MTITPLLRKDVFVPVRSFSYVILEPLVFPPVLSLSQSNLPLKFHGLLVQGIHERLQIGVENLASLTLFVVIDAAIPSSAHEFSFILAAQIPGHAALSATRFPHPHPHPNPNRNHPYHAYNPDRIADPGAALPR